MASTRITAGLRDSIVSALLRHRFNLEELAIQEEADRISKHSEQRTKGAYEMVFTEAERKRLAEAPKGWFPEVHSVRVQIEGGHVCEVHFDSPQRVPYEVKDGGWRHVTAVVSPDSHYFKIDREVQDMQEALGQRRAKLREARATLRARAEAVINSVTTVKRLLEVWPELHEFLPEENAGPSGDVPAIMIADLNEQFGLAKAA
jgi:hypothetical protein